METFNSKRFKAVYAEKLADAMKDHPTEYAFPASMIPVVAERMTKALATGEANKDGYAVRRTCSRLEIPYTYAGIKEFLQGDFKLVRNPEDPNYWDLMGPEGLVHMHSQGYAEVSTVLDAIRSGAGGISEADEVAEHILDSVK